MSFQTPSRNLAARMADGAPSTAEGDLRLARTRGRSVRDQHDLADEDDRLRNVRTGQVGAAERSCSRTSSSPPANRS